MQINIVQILAVVILSQGVALFMLLRRGQGASKRITSQKWQVASVLKVMDSYNKLTAIKWYTDMMLNEETGKLNIAQLQFLHKIAVESDAVIASLQSASEELRSSISSENLIKEAKKGGSEK